MSLVPPPAVGNDLLCGRGPVTVPIKSKDNYAAPIFFANCMISLANKAGCSIAAKCPPFGISVQC